MADDNIVTKWSLDAKTFNAGIKSLKRSMSDLHAGIRLATGAIGAFTSAMGEVLTRGATFARLQDANTLSIDKARQATRGLVSDMELLKSANSAVAFDLGLSSKQFAKMSEAAVVMSQKLGIDANKAIGDLILGLSRQSRKILDNLGIIVSVSDANKAYAATIGKSAKALTDAEQKTAFMNATMRELGRLTGDTRIQIRNAGDQYEALTNQLDNSINGLSRAIIETRAFKDLLEGIATTIGDFATGVRLLAGNIGIMDKAVSKSLRRMSVWVDIFRPGAGKGLREIASALAEFRVKNQNMTSAIDKGVEEGPQLHGLGTRQGTKQDTKSRRGKRTRTEPGLFFPTGLDQPPGPPSEAATNAMLELQAGGAIPALADQMALLNQESITSIGLEREKAQAFSESAKAMQESTIAMQAQTVEAQNMQVITGTLNSIGGGFLDAAAAAIEGTESFGVSLLKMLKSVTLGLSKQLLAYGINAVIQAKASSFVPFVGPVLAAQWGTAAGIYFAGAATMGALGLGLTAASASASGGASSGGARSGGASAASAPVFTNRNRPKTEQPINVNVYLGDPGDPSAALISSQMIARQVSQ